MFILIVVGRKKNYTLFLWCWAFLDQVVPDEAYATKNKKIKKIIRIVWVLCIKKKQKAKVAAKYDIHARGHLGRWIQINILKSSILTLQLKYQCVLEQYPWCLPTKGSDRAEEEGYPDSAEHCSMY